jgi:hypothetical protein
VSQKNEEVEKNDKKNDRSVKTKQRITLMNIHHKNLANNSRKWEFQSHLYLTVRSIPMAETQHPRGCLTTSYTHTPSIQLKHGRGRGLVQSRILSG